MTKPADKPQWVRIAEQFEHSGLTQKQCIRPGSDVRIRPAEDVLGDLVEMSALGHTSTHDQASR